MSIAEFQYGVKSIVLREHNKECEKKPYLDCFVWLLVQIVSGDIKIRYADSLSPIDSQVVHFANIFCSELEYYIQVN